MSSQSIMVQSRTTGCAFQSLHPAHRTAIRTGIIAQIDGFDPIPNGGTDRRGWRRVFSRIDFAPPICAFSHSTTDADGSISRFSEADDAPTPRKEKSRESRSEQRRVGKEGVSTCRIGGLQNQK